MPRIRRKRSATGPKRSNFSVRWPPRADCDSNLLDTLAAAYAEAGRFDDALQTAETAIEKVRGEKKSPESIADLQRRAARYKKGQPYREQQLLGLPTAAGSEKRK